MNYENYHIYIVEGEDQLGRCKSFFEEFNAAANERDRWAKTWGGTGTVIRGASVVGLIVKKGVVPIADGVWKRMGGKGWTFSEGVGYTPNRRTKEGKSLVSAMRALKVPTSRDLACQLGATEDAIIGSCLVASQCYQLGSHWILITPRRTSDELAPSFDGCRRLKLSEFYALKELVDAMEAGR